MFEQMLKAMGINPAEIQEQIKAAAAKIQQMETTLNRVDANLKLLLNRFPDNSSTQENPHD